jgi:diaminopimelate decarboxylase
MTNNIIQNIRRIVKYTQTPFYLYDSKVIKQKYYQLYSSLPEKFEIFYAIKANPHTAIVTELSKIGAGADVASEGELKIALRSGIKPEKISFAGPGKIKEDLRAAVEKGICSISLESEEEAVILDNLSRKIKKNINVSIRVNPREGSLKAGLRMGGGSQQFGVDEVLVPGLIDKIKKSRNLNFFGIHMHTGSQILSEEIVASNIEYLLNFCAGIQKDKNIKIKLINFGGGLGIPYYSNQKPLDIGRMSALIDEAIKKTKAQERFKEARFILEPGRFLVGESGLYVTKVLYKKRSAGKTILIVDGGMHQNLAAAGLLGEGIKRNRIITVIQKRPIRNSESVTIAGCLCTPLDVLARDIRLPVCLPGDHLCITCSGAYSYTASPLKFLSHPYPKEMII